MRTVSSKNNNKILRPNDYQRNMQNELLPQFIRRLHKKSLTVVLAILPAFGVVTNKLSIFLRKKNASNLSLFSNNCG